MSSDLRDTLRRNQVRDDAREFIAERGPARNDTELVGRLLAELDRMQAGRRLDNATFSEFIRLTAEAAGLTYSDNDAGLGERIVDTIGHSRATLARIQAVAAHTVQAGGFIVDAHRILNIIGGEA